MNAMEWNKKDELVADQALKHLKQYTPLLGALTESGRSQLTLIIKVQEYCYDNMNFLKVFSKIVVLFYRGKSHTLFEISFSLLWDLYVDLLIIWLAPICLMLIPVC